MSASERTSGRCAGEVRRRVALVGKGLTFDSGGYNLKVGGMIEMMKFDCGGAVLGAAEALAGIRPPGVEARARRQPAVASNERGQAAGAGGSMSVLAAACPCCRPECSPPMERMVCECVV